MAPLLLSLPLRRALSYRLLSRAFAPVWRQFQGDGSLARVYHTSRLLTPFHGWLNDAGGVTLLAA